MGKEEGAGTKGRRRRGRSGTKGRRLGTRKEEEEEEDGEEE